MARPDSIPKADELQPYTVTRAICMAGERVEIGATVMLTRTQGTELAAAGKVTPGAAQAAAPADAGEASEGAKPTKPAKGAAKTAAQPEATTPEEATP